MRMSRCLLAAAVATVFTVSLSACGSDGSDDDSTEDNGSPAPQYDADLLQSRVKDYQDYVVKEATTMTVATKTFTDAIRAGDAEKARSTFADSRYHWETIEPIAGLVSDVDGAVDSRVDDFASVTDPAFTGWHRLEYILWEQQRLDSEASIFATTLDEDLAKLPDLVAGLTMAPKDVAQGAAEPHRRGERGKAHRRGRPLLPH